MLVTLTHLALAYPLPPLLQSPQLPVPSLPLSVLIPNRMQPHHNHHNVHHKHLWHSRLLSPHHPHPVYSYHAILQPWAILVKKDQSTSAPPIRPGRTGVVGSTLLDGCFKTGTEPSHHLWAHHSPSDHIKPLQPVLDQTVFRRALVQHRPQQETSRTPSFVIPLQVWTFVRSPPSQLIFVSYFLIRSLVLLRKTDYIRNPLFFTAFFHSREITPFVILTLQPYMLYGVLYSTALHCTARVLVAFPGRIHNSCSCSSQWTMLCFVGWCPHATHADLSTETLACIFV